MWAREGLCCNNTTALASTDCLWKNFSLKHEISRIGSMDPLRSGLSSRERLTANGIVGTMQIWEEIFNKPAKLTRSTLSV
ncbi:hypothetical protein Q7C36_002679 [Tachysurus vachellii]|uniref:Uncharacterized protein n=1 Tax=Tachysurus vachellii TaxID=175792 RepID=A0AA88NY93_TACVA|nr:hypothetical protein Q7C36_002679 [Tachysurus vachellii]